MSYLKPAVAFHVHDGQTNQAFGAGSTYPQAIVLNQGIPFINEGNAASAGIFTAPVAGIYYFKCNFLHQASGNGGRGSIGFRLNGAEFPGNQSQHGMAWSSGSLAVDYDTMPFSLIYELEAGDTIQPWVERSDNAQTYTEGPLSNFMGWLID